MSHSESKYLSFCPNAALSTFRRLDVTRHVNEYTSIPPLGVPCYNPCVMTMEEPAGKFSISIRRARAVTLIDVTGDLTPSKPAPSVRQSKVCFAESATGCFSAHADLPTSLVQVSASLCVSTSR
jgi:hypothetical protein